jgi:hypothetical protein
VTLTDLFVYVRDGGTIAVLLLIIVGGMRGWYVWKWYADELRDRNRQLESRIERAVGVAESGTVAADRATRLAERHHGAPSA